MEKKYEEVSSYILNGLSEFEGFYSREYFLDFKDRIVSMKNKIEDSMKEGRLLRIGIVGEIKAGKSSFLNALIFDGKDVLPQEVTPMTATLTKIVYSKVPYAKIVFYSEKDWGRVVCFADEYDKKFDYYYKEYKEKCKNQQQGKFGIKGGEKNQKLKSKEEIKTIFDESQPSQLVSCKKLTEIFEQSSVDLSEYFGKTIELQMDDMEAVLHDYIGVNGKYISIVKHVELGINNEMLKNIEIVDTPGLNDPIISRSEITKHFLGECDVVFLLSYLSQFLTQDDISFICETLPNEGIRNIIIIGSKFDAALIDDNESKDIRTACNSSKVIYDKMASDNIKKCLTSGYNQDILKRIQDSLPPSYISSTLFSCAQKKKNGEPYTKRQQNIIAQLKKHFKDFEDDEKIMLSLSGIHQVKKNKLRPIMDSKQEIIAERNMKILSDNKRILIKLLEDINIQALQNKDDLEHYGKEELENKLQLLQNKLNSMRREIRNIFENSSVEAAKFLNNMKVNIDLEIDNYIDFEVKSEDRRKEVPKKFLGIITYRWTTCITTVKTASVSDVISNLRRYISRCKKYANEEFEKIININKLESAIKETVIGAFDLSDRKFNENDILIPLEIVIKKIQIPKIDIDVTDFESLIIDAFYGASVEGNDIYKLQLLENRVLGEIAKKINVELDKSINKIDEIMTEQATFFVDNIISQLKENIEMLRTQIDNKENAIRQYNTLNDLLIEYKKMVNEMEM